MKWKKKYIEDTNTKAEAEGDQWKKQWAYTYKTVTIEVMLGL